MGYILLKKFEQSPQLINRSSFETLTLLGNPKAIDKCVRYIDKDLNRCFNFQALDYEKNNSFYENQRAQEISNQFGLSENTPIDLVVDQHSTTSNVGLMLILDHLDPFILNLSAYLVARIPDLKIYSSAISGRAQDSLRSIAKYRFGIEVGPICHGSLQADLLQKTEILVYEILDYVVLHNRNAIEIENTLLTVYEYVNSIDYPRSNEGVMIAMIHPQLEGQDYKALNSGDPIFMTFDGEIITYQGRLTVYPVFVNEVAYYEKKVAMSLTRKKSVQLDELTNHPIDYV
ncbi:aspartoacylase [Acaryochloris sp. 'Moss Beach']|uniref:aspartoacylase n=1 Tax=Acaryochloris sp. 'Moss Beach' TaxID=2740837 RepID=UPI001F3DB4E6|nr:aspartoacylase [Acaryochloris sp. 'Moss Beach']UJB71143.1 aspartoacylase [Acaryochloris sp. 'Moss Beach']